MAEARTPAVMPLQFLKQETDGYCDPVSGVVCPLGAARGTSDPDPDG